MSSQIGLYLMFSHIARLLCRHNQRFYLQDCMLFSNLRRSNLSIFDSSEGTNFFVANLTRNNIDN